jgi:TPR repeat protein
MRCTARAHADGANSFEFPWGARGVEQNFEMAVDYFGFARDPDHLEAKLNRARCY